MAKLAVLQHDPAWPGSDNATADDYTTDFVVGVIVYAVLAGRRQIVLLRVTALDV